MESKGVELNWHSLVGTKNEWVAEVILNRPEAANALSIPVQEGLLHAFAEVERRGSACRMTLMRGRGKNFCGGADLNWLSQGQTQAHDENIKDSSRLMEVFEALSRLSCPTLAAVHGAAFGGGLGLASACDYAVATKSSCYSLTEVKRGVSASVILRQLRSKVPEAILKRWVLTGEVITAAEAYRCGLIAELFPEAEFWPAVRREVERLLTGEPHTQRLFKETYHEAVRDNEEWAARAVDILAKSRAAPAAGEGITAFFEKRPPHWVGGLGPEFLKAAP